MQCFCRSQWRCHGSCRHFKWRSLRETAFPSVWWVTTKTLHFDLSLCDCIDYLICSIWCGAFAFRLLHGQPRSQNPPPAHAAAPEQRACSGVTSRAARHGRTRSTSGSCVTSATRARQAADARLQRNGNVLLEGRSRSVSRLPQISQGQCDLWFLISLHVLGLPTSNDYFYDSGFYFGGKFGWLRKFSWASVRHFYCCPLTVAILLL